MRATLALNRLKKESSVLTVDYDNIWDVRTHKMEINISDNTPAQLS